MVHYFLDHLARRVCGAFLTVSPLPQYLITFYTRVFCKCLREKSTPLLEQSLFRKGVDVPSVVEALAQQKQIYLYSHLNVIFFAYGKEELHDLDLKELQHHRNLNTKPSSTLACKGTLDTHHSVRDELVNGSY